MNLNNNAIVQPQQEAPQSISSSEVINVSCNGITEELALYPADSLHISKTLNPFDIIITICLNCDNYQCTNPNNPVVILRSRWSLHPAIVPIEGVVLFELPMHMFNGKILLPDN